MKLIPRMFVVSASLALLLSACGTAEETATNTNSNVEQTEKAPSQANEQEAEEQVKETTEAEEAAEPKNDEKQPSTDEKVRLLEQNLTYEEQGKIVEKTGFLKTSDNQNYSMYVLDGYTLEAEEPGRDIIMLSADQKAFMRIELVPSDVSLETAEDVLKTTAEAISKEAEKYEQFKQEGMLKDAVWYKAKTDEDVVNLILIKGETPVKLTIYTPIDEENIEPFLAMAETIEQNK